MKRTLILMAALAVLVTGCSRALIPTKDIYFYRDSGLNEGRPCAIDIIYPKDKAERDKIINEIGPQKWFQSELYDIVPKDKVWLEPDSWLEVKPLQNKQLTDAYMIIFAEFTNPSPRPPRGQEPYLYYEKDMKPKPRKHEYVEVHDGSLERLESSLKRSARP
jgi:hypothetical protein